MLGNRVYQPPRSYGVKSPEYTVSQHAPVRMRSDLEFNYTLNTLLLLQIINTILKKILK